MSNNTSDSTGRRRRMGQQVPDPGEAGDLVPAPSEPQASRRTRMGGTSEAPYCPAAQTEIAPRRTGAPSNPAALTAPAHLSASESADTSSVAKESSPDLPRRRITRRLIPLILVVVLGIVTVLLARWLRNLTGVESFIGSYSGHTERHVNAPIGVPPWLGWQHFFNMFFLVLIVRTGLQVRWEKRQPASWTPRENSFFAPPWARPKKVSLTQWLHQSLDVLWVLNGLLFMVLLFVSSQWMRIVPMSWDVFPHAISSLLQYASLDWPYEDGWVHYNALQVLAYFCTVFIAAPLAVLSGIRMSTWWPHKNATLSRLFPLKAARTVHFPVMVYFIIFTVVHVFQVFFTGALSNLNHMFTSRDAADWWGLVVFAGSLIVIAAAWVFTRPLFMRPLAARSGEVTKA